MALLNFWSVKPKAPATTAMTTKASVSSTSLDNTAKKEEPKVDTPLAIPTLEEDPRENDGKATPSNEPSAIGDGDSIKAPSVASLGAKGTEEAEEADSSQAQPSASFSAPPTAEQDAPALPTTHEEEDSPVRPPSPENDTGSVKGGEGPSDVQEDDAALSSPAPVPFPTQATQDDVVADEKEAEPEGASGAVVPSSSACHTDSASVVPPPSIPPALSDYGHDGPISPPTVIEIPEQPDSTASAEADMAPSAPAAEPATTTTSAISDTRRIQHAEAQAQGAQPPSSPISPRQRRFSLKALASRLRQPPGPDTPPPASPSPLREHDEERPSSASSQNAHPALPPLPPPTKPAALASPTKRSKPTRGLSFRLARGLSSSSDAKARDGALLVRQLIVGPAPSSAPQAGFYAKSKTGTAPPPSAQALQHVKGTLLDPRAANKLIAALRVLPAAPDAPVSAKPSEDAESAAVAAPIHAVCLPYTEQQADEVAFRRLEEEGERSSEDEEGRVQGASFAGFSVPSVLSAPVDKISSLLREIKLVDLVGGEDGSFGLGQPGDGEGILAGAVPTAETVIKGVTQITPQLMNLGYATSKAILPDHKGVHPPLDRMSVLTYWWGLEVCLPPPSLKYLSQVPSVAHAIINFLTALSVVHNGVREALPFVRYISQYIDFEFGAIQQMDNGQGVVCAATWIMPAAMVARPWDFPPPESSDPSPAGGDSKQPGESPSIGVGVPSLNPIVEENPQTTAEDALPA